VGVGHVDGRGGKSGATNCFLQGSGNKASWVMWGGEGGGGEGGGVDNKSYDN
jgi:hypothetical protein